MRRLPGDHRSGRRLPRHGNNHAIILLASMKRVALLVAIMSAIAGEVFADPFDPPMGGAWICPDGHVRYVAGNTCVPKEFNGVRWWESCIASRDDCMHSDRAVVGWSTIDTKTIRGSGYCYTQQPWTCSPDGKLP